MMGGSSRTLLWDEQEIAHKAGHRARITLILLPVSFIIPFVIFVIPIVSFIILPVIFIVVPVFIAIPFLLFR
jgi:hypothetical protein